MNRLRADIDTGSPVLDHIGTLALEAGLAFLGFETRTLFTWLGTWRRQLAELARASELADLTTTAFGATHMVVLGADDLLAYFARGDIDRLERGRARLRDSRHRAGRSRRPERPLGSGAPARAVRRGRSRLAVEPGRAAARRPRRWSARRSQSAARRC